MRGRPSPALVISLAAMTIAIAGTALMARAGSGGPDTGKVVGYALVTDTGDVQPKKSLNVTNANVRLVPFTNVQFCFKGLPFKFRGAQVTTDQAGSHNQGSTAQFTKSVSGQCNENEPATVWTNNPNTPSDPEPFYIVFYK